jgi:hypothetical protein
VCARSAIMLSMGSALLVSSVADTGYVTLHLRKGRRRGHSPSACLPATGSAAELVTTTSSGGGRGHRTGRSRRAAAPAPRLPAPPEVPLRERFAVAADRRVAI